MSEVKFLEKLVAAIDALGKLLADERRQYCTDLCATREELIKLRAEVAELRAELKDARALGIIPAEIARRVN